MSNEKPIYPPNVEHFIAKWQPSETARRKAFWKEFRKAANAYNKKESDGLNLMYSRQLSQNTLLELELIETKGEVTRLEQLIEQMDKTIESFSF